MQQGLTMLWADAVLQEINTCLARTAQAEKFARALDGAGTGADTATASPAASGDLITSTDWCSTASAVTFDLVEAFVAHCQSMRWMQPYPGNPMAGRGFEGRALATRCIGEDAPVPAADFACGFFVVGSDIDYADHQHLPEELYLPIAGSAQYWNEADGWQTRSAGDVIVHPPWQWHAMRTGAEPVLILWMWFGPEGIGIEPLLRPTLGGADAEWLTGG